MTIDLEPIPWQRPKTRVVKGWVQHYSPQKTQKYEKSVAEIYKQKSGGAYWEKNEPISVSLWFGLPIPKSASKAKADAMFKGDIKHTKRPDLDNLTKAVLDGLNGVAWADDSQIMHINARKYYTTVPNIWVHIIDEIN